MYSCWQHCLLLLLQPFSLSLSLSLSRISLNPTNFLSLQSENKKPFPCSNSLQIQKPTPKNTVMLHAIISILCFLSPVICSEPASIYEALKSNGLPVGLLPKGVTNFSLDDSGNFQVFLDQACNAKFEDELHYDRNVSGKLTYGQIKDLSGISARDLFLWFEVKEIRVDVPSSGLIYFNVGVVSKQFSLSSFETPRECMAAQLPLISNIASENLPRKLGHHLSRKEISREIL